jgi:glutamate synthase (NADPH/NADH) large chain
MTGGEAYVHDREDLVATHLNVDLVAAETPDAEELTRLRELLERHVRYTGSPRATVLLDDWMAESRHFRRVAPRTEARDIERSVEVVSEGAA